MARWLLAILVVAFAVPAQAEMIRLRYGESHSTLRSIFSLPIFVAERQGFFLREGLDFQMIVPQPDGSDNMIKALHDGMFDITHVPTPYLIRRALAGSDVVAIAGEFKNAVYSLIAKPGIKNFSDLKGKRIGFADKDGTITLSMRKLLALHGLKEGDYIVELVEGTPSRFSCLKAGDCDAVPLGQPHDVTAQAEGFTLLGRSTEAMPAILYTVTAVRRSWAEANQEAVTRYLRALRAAFKFIHDPDRRREVIDIVANNSGMSKTTAAAVLSLFFEPERNVLPLEGEIDMAGLANVIALMAERGEISGRLPAPEQFVERKYLQAAGVK